MTALEKAARALEARLKEKGFLDYEEGARAVISSIEVDDAMVEVARQKWPEPWEEYNLGKALRAALTASLRSILDNGAGR